MVKGLAASRPHFLSFALLLLFLCYCFSTAAEQLLPFFSNVGVRASAKQREKRTVPPLVAVVLCLDSATSHLGLDRVYAGRVHQARGEDST